MLDEQTRAKAIALLDAETQAFHRRSDFHIRGKAATPSDVSEAERALRTSKDACVSFLRELVAHDEAVARIDRDELWNTAPLFTVALKLRDAAPGAEALLVLAPEKPFETIEAARKAGALAAMNSCYPHHPSEIIIGVASKLWPGSVAEYDADTVSVFTGEWSPRVPTTDPEAS